MTAAVASNLGEAPAPTIDHRRDRLGFFVWALLFFNVLAFAPGIPLLLPIPSAVGKLATQGSLALATILVLAFNRNRLIRPPVWGRRDRLLLRLERRPRASRSSNICTDSCTSVGEGNTKS